jgi:hypothetical protein
MTQLNTGTLCAKRREDAWLESRPASDSVLCRFCAIRHGSERTMLEQARSVGFQDADGRSPGHGVQAGEIAQRHRAAPLWDVRNPGNRAWADGSCAVGKKPGHAGRFLVDHRDAIASVQ